MYVRSHFSPLDVAKTLWGLYCFDSANPEVVSGHVTAVQLARALGVELRTGYSSHFLLFESVYILSHDVTTEAPLVRTVSFSRSPNRDVWFQRGAD